MFVGKLKIMLNFEKGIYFKRKSYKSDLRRFEKAISRNQQDFIKLDVLFSCFFYQLP